MKSALAVAALVAIGFGLGACGHSPNRSSSQPPSTPASVSTPAVAQPITPSTSVPTTSAPVNQQPAAQSSLAAVQSDEGAASAGTNQSDRDYQTGVVSQSQNDSP